MTKTSVFIKRQGAISFLSQGLKGEKEDLKIPKVVELAMKQLASELIQEQKTDRPPMIIVGRSELGKKYLDKFDEKKGESKN